MRNLRVGEATLDAVYDKNAEGITLRLNRRAPGTCKVVFAPAVSPYTQVTGAEINDRPVQFKIEPNSTDQHVRVEFPLYGGETTLHIRLRNDFGIANPSELPPLGEKSRNLKITSERWNAAHDQLELQVAGIPGHSFRPARVAARAWRAIRSGRKAADSRADAGEGDTHSRERRRNG